MGIMSSSLVFSSSVCLCSWRACRKSPATNELAIIELQYSRDMMIHITISSSLSHLLISLSSETHWTSTTTSLDPIHTYFYLVTSRSISIRMEGFIWLRGTSFSLQKQPHTSQLLDIVIIMPLHSTYIYTHISICVCGLVWPRSKCNFIQATLNRMKKKTCRRIILIFFFWPIFFISFLG